VTLDEAPPIIAKRKKFYEQKAERVNEEVIKIRANITRVKINTYFL